MVYRLFVVVFLAAACAFGKEVKVIKVLPHLLDQKGRHTLAPSLYERDAYQAYLRENPREVSALRYDVQWKGGQRGEKLRLRLEFRGSRTAVAEVRSAEVTVQPKGMFSNWSSIQIDPETYQALGQIIAWRATLWRGEEKVAEQLSFLW